MTNIHPDFTLLSVCRLCACLSMALFTIGEINAQDLARRPLDHQDYDVWNTMSQSGISKDGNWAMYLVQNGAIDGETRLHLQDLKTAREYVIERGGAPQFTSDSRFAVYLVNPEKKKLKQLRAKKTPADQLPQAELQILELETGAIRTLDRVRSYKIPKEGDQWLACLISAPADKERVESQKLDSRETYEVTAEGLRRSTKPLKLKSREQLALERGERELEEPAAEKETSEKGDENKEKQDKQKEKTAGTPLMLVNLATAVQRSFPAAVSYEFSKNGELLAFTSSIATEENSKAKPAKDAEKAKPQSPDRPQSLDRPKDGVHVLTLKTMQHATVCEGVGEYKNLAIADDGSQIAFITNKDDYESKHPAWTLYHWTRSSKQAQAIVKEKDKGLPIGWWISLNSRQQFSEDGRRLYFDTAPLPEEVVKERADQANSGSEKEQEEEKAKLDIWHWQDPQLQPQQLLQAAAERNRDYRASYVFNSKKVVQLATREIPSITIDYGSPSALAVATSNQPYRKMLSWDTPGYEDTYLIDLNTGAPQSILTRVKWAASLSPEGKHIVWFDREQKKWFAKSTNEPETAPLEISQGIPHPLQDELHDTPNLPSAYGAAGWMPSDAAFLVYDSYDIWSLDPTGKAKPICITNGEGRKNDLRYRYRQLDREQRAIDPGQPLLLEAFNRKTKASGFYVLRLAGAKPEGDESTAPELESLIMLDESLGGLQKAEKGDAVLFTRSTFRQCPDLWSSDLGFKKIARVSDINPQQVDYSWGTAELVQWNAADGQLLDGILMKPDGFDPAKKYPLMVYFYERDSDNLHSYYPPAAGRSIICHSFYVSRGYMVFIPDIPYKTGEPGPSAVNSVIPGVQNLIAKGFVDEQRVGMQGHSWGGYQTAYLVTQTDLFACAESGAPVSNMTSAYGGIRWSSGMSRMFQYERTQSRIGEDLWTAREKYLANSPLFLADKINTPVLILHNDEDGAVPWYQGIELFVALRRLEKPAWLLNYNGNPHWVMGDANRRDFAVRMQQFFDHYLLDAPEPEWMAVGIRAVDKGENFGLELLEPEKVED